MMRLAGGCIRPGEGLEINPVMGHECPALTDGVRQLLGVAPAKLAGLSCRYSSKSARPHETRHQDVNILVHIELDE